MKKDCFAARLTALRECLRSSETGPCDTAWIIHPENRRYFSGFTASDGSCIESSGSLLITQTRSVLVTDSRYQLQAETETAGWEIDILKKDLIETLPELLQKLGTRTLGFEPGHLSWGFHGMLQERLNDLSPAIELVPLNEAVEDMREVKDSGEIEALQAAADLISDVLDKMVRRIKPGMTEKAVAWEIEGLAREAGADGLSFPAIVASGPNSAHPHAVPTDRKIKPREPIVMDLGARLNGYCSDMTRTLFLGEPSREFKNIYRTVRQAQLAALKAVQPLVKSTFLDEEARGLIREAGYGDYFGHGLGHGVGLAVHERPKVGPRNPVALQEGTVFTIEPGIYIPRKGGVRLEEMVAMEVAGPRVLTQNNIYYDF